MSFSPALLKLFCDGKRRVFKCAVYSNRSSPHPGFQSLVRGLKINYTHQLVTGLSGSRGGYLLAGLAVEVKKTAASAGCDPGGEGRRDNSGRPDGVPARVLRYGSFRFWSFYPTFGVLAQVRSWWPSACRCWKD